MTTLPGLEGYESGGSSSSSSSSSSSTDDATKILQFDVTTKGENEQATAPKQDGSRISTTNDPLSEAMQTKTGPETESECSSVSVDESSCDDLSTDIEVVAALIGSNAAGEDDDDEDCTEAPRTKNEIVDAPIEPTPLDVDIEGRELSIAGNIISVIMSEGSVVVMSAPGLGPLDEDTVLCCTKSYKEGKFGASSVIGCISEVFGPVSRPHYFIRCNPKRLSELKEAGFLLEPGSHVMSVGGMTSYLSQEALLAQRSGGCDASDAFDEELPPDQVEFSDDEKEMIAKGGRRKKRGGNGKVKEGWGWGWGEDSGHKERDQSSKSCFDSRVHPQRRLQHMMPPPNYQRNLQQQSPFSQFQQYNREQPCGVPRHPWVATRQGGFTPPIQQEVRPNNYQCQNEIRGQHQQQFQQPMNLRQHLPNLQPQWPYQSMLCAPQQQPRPLHFNQASNQCAMWHGPPQPPQPSLPSTPYHALNLVPSSYHDTHREGGHNLDPPPRKNLVHD